MLIPIFLLAVLEGGQSTPANDSMMGSYLFPRCKALIRAVDHEPAQNGDTLNSIYCLGFVEGFVAGLNDAEEKVCVSDAAPNTLARVYVAYMEKHPKLLDKTSNVGLYFALAESYPCKAPR